MDDDPGDITLPAAQNSQLSENANTVRERKRRRALDEDALAADKRRKADNESYRRAKNVVMARPGFKDMAPEEQELAIRERIDKLQTNRYAIPCPSNRARHFTNIYS